LLGKESNSLIHASDWLKTLVTVASGQPDWLAKNLPAGEPPFVLGDGLDVWPSLSNGSSVRTEILYECQPANGTKYHGNALRVGDWKISWLGNLNNIRQRRWPTAPGQDPSKINYSVLCNLSQQPTEDVSQQCSKQFCLFNITADPCEYNDVSSSFPDVLGVLINRLAEYQRTAVPAVNATECGCAPLTSFGALRPCNATDPAGVRDRVASSPSSPSSSSLPPSSSSQSSSLSSSAAASTTAPAQSANRANKDGIRCLALILFFFIVNAS